MAENNTNTQSNNNENDRRSEGPGFAWYAKQAGIGAAIAAIQGVALYGGFKLGEFVFEKMTGGSE